MYYFWLTVFLTLLVFIGRLPATIRRVRAQREALRPVQPVARSDHFSCVLNTIGVALTEFSLLGLTTLAVFIGAGAALGTLGQAPDFTTGLRHLSFATIATIVALGTTLAILLNGGMLGRTVFLIGSFLVIVFGMVMSTAGDQAPAILLFALFAVGIPTLIIAILRLFF